MGAVWDDPRVQRGMRAQLELRRRALEEGAGRLGWKVAFGSAQVREALGIDAPLTGFLTTRSIVAPGATYSIAGWTKPALEPEIAVHMGRDLGAGATRAETGAAIAALAPAIELADLDRPLEELEAILAEHIFQRAVILGEPDPDRAGGSAEGLSARVFTNGSEVAATEDPEGFAGDVVEIVRHVAELLAAFGESLRAGDVVITGAVVPHVWPSPGDHVAYELLPLGRIDVTLAA